MRRVLVLPVVILTGLALSATATLPDGRPTPTGLPVPRWLSLKSDEVRARAGPGLDYRILWEYRAARLPVQVVAETREWRKICDPEGAVAWVHRSVVSSRRTAFNPAGAPAPVHARPDDASRLAARLSPRSLIAVDDCEDGWCRVRDGRLRGWIEARRVWGAAETARCDALSRPGVR
ncbi:SH3 domain-containing protein [Brevundimonas balnearis]|uniref:SH3 domain-containing protein n=1 Tax=Brevundimonas balnearis TaxID=1572858 RepID=A0ABV6R504_9CAUL